MAREINGDMPDAQAEAERAYRPHPAVVQNFLSQMQGRDVIDVKFFAFSRRRTRGDVVGAEEPLSIYTSSALLEGRCEHFQRRKLSRNTLVQLC